MDKLATRAPGRCRTSRGLNLKVMIFQKDVMDEYREVTFQTGGRTAVVSFTKGPGLYTVKIVDQFDTVYGHSNQRENYLKQQGLL